MSELYGNWWSGHYRFRQRLSVAAHASKAIPAGYPISCVIDTDALVSASKMRSDRKDFRIVYWNGSAWSDLTRDYIANQKTFFPAQAQIAAGNASDAYYAYYGYAAEATDKQPTTSADWNTVYFGTGWDDANAMLIQHFREGSGSTVNDDSGNGLNFSFNGSPSWTTNNLLGRGLDFPADPNVYIYRSGFNYSPITLEAVVETDGSSTDWGSLFHMQGYDGQNAPFYAGVWSTTPGWEYDTGGGTPGCQSSETLTNGNLYHLAYVYDGSAEYVYVNGVVRATVSGGRTQRGTDKNMKIGMRFNGKIYHTRISNTNRTSFPIGLGTAYAPTVTISAEKGMGEILGAGLVKALLL